MPTPLTRPARPDDGAALGAVDALTWTPATSPAPAPPPGTPFFGPRTAVEDVLVAELDGEVVGYAALGHPTPLAASAHVLEVQGLAVVPAAQGLGAGRALLAACRAAARERGAWRLTLRVLAPNTRARALYAACGFVEEGVLRGEFLLAGEYVDDVLMACDLVRA